MRIYRYGSEEWKCDRCGEIPPMVFRVRYYGDKEDWCPACVCSEFPKLGGWAEVMP